MRNIFRDDWMPPIKRYHPNSQRVLIGIVDDGSSEDDGVVNLDRKL
jgi:hypothetical protein